MNDLINEIAFKYSSEEKIKRKNVMKETIQEMVLCSLSRIGFFDEAAFYGGSALRIFYGLNRFSEDLDFSLVIKNENFDLNKYINVLIKEMNVFKLNVDIEYKNKNIDSNIQSAFIKANTNELILHFYPLDKDRKDYADNDSVKIKFEIDTDPAEYAIIETKYSATPMPYSLRIYDSSSLFAGKVHALLCRSWKNRIKGRDLFDYIFYIQKGIKINLKNLNAKLRQSGYLKDNEYLNINELRQHLSKHFDSIDYEEAKKDVISFIDDKKILDIWCADFFKSITNEIEDINNNFDKN